jgi:hypothetical protein
MKNIIRKISNFKIILIFIIGIVLIFSYKSEFIMFKGIDKLEELTQGKLGVRNIRTNIMKTFDELSVPNYFSSYYDLPLLDISMSQKSINAVSRPINNALNYEDTYYKSKYMLPIHGNKYTSKSKIKLTYNGQTYKAKIKTHGRSEEHFLGKKKSYAIKFNKSKLFDNMREIALIILDEQDITTIFSYFLVSKYLDIDVQSKLVRVRINGVGQGLYLLEEKVRKELLEKNQLSGVDIVSPNAMWTTQTATTHTHQFTHNISGIQMKDFSKKNNGQLLKYKKIHSINSYRDLSKMVDIDKFAKFEAIRMLHADRHAAGGDNLKLFYDNSSGLYSPFYRSESVIGDLEKYMSNDMYTYDTLAKDFHIFRILTQDDNFRNLRNKYLFDIVSDKDEIIAFYEGLLENYINAIDEDVSNLLSQREYMYVAQSNFKIFKNNIEIVGNYLKYGRVYTLLTSINPREYVLEIDADANSFLKIKAIDLFDNNKFDTKVLVVDSDGRKTIVHASELIDYFNKENYILGVDKNLESKDNKKKYFLFFDKDVNLENFKIGFVNTVTGEKVKEIDNYVKYIKKPKSFSFDYLNDDLEKFLKSNKGFSILDGKIIKFTNKEYSIKNDLIFPYGYSILIPENVSIKIGEGVSILVYGGITIAGLRDHPVVIESLVDRKPFGSIIAVGDKSTLVNINGLNLSGGSDSSVNGIFASGAMSLHRHKMVKITNSYFHHNHADDGLNIKNSQFNLSGNKFLNNHADQVDIDFSTGRVVDNSFLLETDKESSVVNSNLSDNGDGVDLSGSRVLVMKNIFKGFLDKALSIGEKTTAFVNDNSFINNRSAVTAKDQSDVFLRSNKYENNKLNIETYQKKNFFKNPKVYILNESHKDGSISNISGDFFKIESENTISEILITNIDNMFHQLFSINWTFRDVL